MSFRPAPPGPAQAASPSLLLHWPRAWQPAWRRFCGGLASGSAAPRCARGLLGSLSWRRLMQLWRPSAAAHPRLPVPLLLHCSALCATQSRTTAAASAQPLHNQLTPLQGGRGRSRHGGKRVSVGRNSREGRCVSITHRFMAITLCHPSQCYHAGATAPCVAIQFAYVVCFTRW